MGLSLRIRLSLLAAVPLLLYAGTGLYLVGEQRAVFKEMKTELVESYVEVESLVLNADRDLYQAKTAYLLLESGELDAQASSARLKELSDNYNQAIERIATAREILDTAGLLDYTSGENGKSTAELFDTFQKDFGNWYKDAVELSSDGKQAIVNEALDGMFESGRASIDSISQNAGDHSEQLLNELDEKLDNTMRNVVAVIAVVSIILITLVAFIIHRIMRTIRTVVRKMQLVGEGDLTLSREVRYSKDELGLISRSVDDMIESMRRLISDIAGSTRRVSESSEHLGKAAKESTAVSERVALNIQEVAASSEVQARGAAETSRAMEEMAVGIGRIAENTSELANHSQSTALQADQGQASLHRLVAQMEEVRDVIGKLSATIGTLENRSQEIGAIVENITAFSNQTNILSLNASIEAARAGEHGRGFAVVAGEIRKLAASSLESAESINELVSLTQSDIAGASSFMNKTLVEVERGSEQIKEVSQNLDLITSAVGSMSQQLQENSAIAEQMSASSEEVSASVDQSADTAELNLSKAANVAAATEEQLAFMEKISDASKQLDEIVQQLNGTVAHFKVG